MQKASNNKSELKKSVLWSGGLLALFCLLAISLVIITQQQTAQRITQNQQAFILASLSEVMPLSEYDNDLIKDSYSVIDPLLGPSEVIIYPTLKSGKPSGAILSAIAPNGYNGRIKLLVGVNYSGVIHAVRVIEHKETPGLGDPIEIKRSDWIKQFDQGSLQDPVLEQWLVKKDNGNFDQLTGATITPRAIVQAVKNALRYYEKNSILIHSKNTQHKQSP